MVLLMLVRIPVRGRVGKLNRQYVYYISGEAGEYLANYIGRSVVLGISLNGAWVRVKARLSIAREFKPPRIAIYLPTRLNPTWESLYDKEVPGFIELEEAN